MLLSEESPVANALVFFRQLFMSKVIYCYSQSAISYCSKKQDFYFFFLNEQTSFILVVLS